MVDVNNYVITHMVVLYVTVSLVQVLYTIIIAMHINVIGTTSTSIAISLSVSLVIGTLCILCLILLTGKSHNNFIIIIIIIIYTHVVVIVVVLLKYRQQKYRVPDNDISDVQPTIKSHTDNKTTDT